MMTCKLSRSWKLALLLSLVTATAAAQSFRVQCPTSTITHPNAANNNSEPAYNGPTAFTTNGQGYVTPSANVNGAIKCQQVSGGDGYSTMANGTQTFMFAFGPLSGLSDVAKGLPGTEFPSVFNTLYPGPNTLLPGDPATTDGALANVWPGFPLSTAEFTYNGAVGLAPDIANLVSTLRYLPRHDWEHGLCSNERSARSERWTNCDHLRYRRRPSDGL